MQNANNAILNQACTPTPMTNDSIVNATHYRPSTSTINLNHHMPDGHLYFLSDLLKTVEKGFKHAVKQVSKVLGGAVKAIGKLVNGIIHLARRVATITIGVHVILFGVATGTLNYMVGYMSTVKGALVSMAMAIGVTITLVLAKWAPLMAIIALTGVGSFIVALLITLALLVLLLRNNPAVLYIPQIWAEQAMLAVGMEAEAEEIRLAQVAAQKNIGLLNKDKNIDTSLDNDSFYKTLGKDNQNEGATAAHGLGETDDGIFGLNFGTLATVGIAFIGAIIAFRVVSQDDTSNN